MYKTCVHINTGLHNQAPHTTNQLVFVMYNEKVSNFQAMINNEHQTVSLNVAKKVFNKQNKIKHQNMWNTPSAGMKRSKLAKTQTCVDVSNDIRMGGKKSNNRKKPVKCKNARTSGTAL